MIRLIRLLIRAITLPIPTPSERLDEIQEGLA